MCANRRYFPFYCPHLWFVLRTERVQNLSRSDLALKGCAVPDLLMRCTQHDGPHQSPSERSLLQLKAQTKPSSTSCIFKTLFHHCSSVWPTEGCLSALLIACAMTLYIIPGSEDNCTWQNFSWISICMVWWSPFSSADVSMVVGMRQFCKNF